MLQHLLQVLFGGRLIPYDMMELSDRGQQGMILRRCGPVLFASSVRPLLQGFQCIGRLFAEPHADAGQVMDQASAEISETNDLCERSRALQMFLGSVQVAPLAFSDSQGVQHSNELRRMFAMNSLDEPERFLKAVNRVRQLVEIEKCLTQLVQGKSVFQRIAPGDFADGVYDGPMVR